MCVLIFLRAHGSNVLNFVRNRALPLGMEAMDDWLHRLWGRGADSAGPAPFVGVPGDKRTLLPVAPHPVTNPVDLMRRISEDDAEVEAEAEDVVAREEPGGGAGPEGTRNPARRRQEKAASPPAGTRSQAASPRARGTNCARLRRCFRGHPRDGLRHRDALRADSAVTDPRALVGAARPPPEVSRRGRGCLRRSDRGRAGYPGPASARVGVLLPRGPRTSLRWWHARQHGRRPAGRRRALLCGRGSLRAGVHSAVLRGGAARAPEPGAGRGLGPPGWVCDLCVKLQMLCVRLDHAAHAAQQVVLTFI